MECARLAIDFLKFGLKINCTPPSGHIQTAATTTEDLMDQDSEVFPELKLIPEGLPHLRMIKHESRLIPG